MTIVNDERVEDTETFKLALLSESEDALGGITELQVQISDDDEPPAPPGTVSFERSSIDVNENAGSVQISLLREGGSNGVLNVRQSHLALSKLPW